MQTISNDTSLSPSMTDRRQTDHCLGQQSDENYTGRERLIRTRLIRSST